MSTDCKGQDIDAADAICKDEHVYSVIYVSTAV